VTTNGPGIPFRVVAGKHVQQTQLQYAGLCSRGRESRGWMWVDGTYFRAARLQGAQ